MVKMQVMKKKASRWKGKLVNNVIQYARERAESLEIIGSIEVLRSGSFWAVTANARW